MAEPMFFYVGVYGSSTAAEADCDAIKSLHDTKEIGSYDSAIITKKADGRVRVAQTEKPGEQGAWVGLAAGAGAAVLFPALLPGLIVAGAGGAGLGAWFAHIAHGTSRGEAKRVGAMLSEGDSAVIVIGIDHDAQQVEAVATRAREHTLSRAVGDWDEAQQDALEALEKDEAVPA
jgi:uncharacterized membrane protein